MIYIITIKRNCDGLGMGGGVSNRVMWLNVTMVN